MNWKKTILISALILILAVVLMFVIFNTEPEATQEGATKKSAMLVEVTEAQRGNYTPVIRAMGTVKPARDITLQPRVSGEIIKRSPAFTPGGFVEKGEVLFKIDPADFKNTLDQRKSELRQAIAEMEIEMGRQDVARRDFELLDETLSTDNEELVLRKPQLNSARAAVESARAAVEQAGLELQRTTIKAPFDAHILSREANLGSQVTPSDTLGRLVGMDAYWVIAVVPLAQLRWIEFPENDDEAGAPVQVRNRTAWPEDLYREGRVHKLLGNLEEQARMARVLITVQDPLARENASPDTPKLMIGSYVEARIQAREITDVIRISRDYLRKDETVWVMKDGALDIRDVEITFKDVDYAYISGGLEEGERVVASDLSTVVDGAGLRVEESSDSTAEESQDTGGNGE